MIVPSQESKEEIVKYHSIILLAATSLAACAGSPDNADTQTGLEIRTAPLALDHASDACYTLKVYNDALANLASADTVMQLQHICGSQYGFETEISYVAPCDAQGNNGDPDFKPNTVELILENICTGGACNDPAAPSNAIAMSEYVNPCPASSPCRQEIVCRENADVPVTFNLTVMRDADQGFFDIAVNFSDLFCSAKFDCRDDDNQPISLLHDCNGDRADFTAVLAVACTRGADSANGGTSLYLDPITIACDDGFTVSLDPRDGPGNVLDACVGVPGDTDLTVFQHAVYAGRELLDCDHDDDPNTPDVSCGKIYLNQAIGFDMAELANHPGCTVRTIITAADGQLPNGNTDPTATYPVLRLNAPLTDSQGALVCTQHPVGSSGFDFSYTNVPIARRSFESFRYVFAGEKATVVPAAHTALVSRPLDLALLQIGDKIELRDAPAVGLRANPKVVEGVQDAAIFKLANVPSGAALTYTPPEAVIAGLLAHLPAYKYLIAFHDCASDLPLDNVSALAGCSPKLAWTALYSNTCKSGSECQAEAASLKTAIPAGANTFSIAIGDPTQQKLATAVELEALNKTLLGDPTASDGPIMPQQSGYWMNCPSGEPPCGSDPCVVWCTARSGSFEDCCTPTAVTAEALFKALLEIFGLGS